MSDNENDKLETAGSGIFTPPPVVPSEPVAASINRPSPMIWLGLGMLAVIALAVVFVLPGVVEKYELPLEPRVQFEAPPVSGADVQRTSTNAVSPFNEAQKSIQRKEAQDVLAELLRIQAELDAREIQAWAAAEYEDSLAYARQGDEAYLQQDFSGASEQYSLGVESLQSLMERVPEVLEENLAAGEAALAASDSEEALARFGTALALDPDSSRAQLGFRRAQSLDEVGALLRQGTELADRGDLEAARTLYRNALDLDDRNERAQQSLRDIEGMILQRQFSQIMSEGFARLRNDDPESAIEAFERASTLGINQDQAQAAIQQTRDEVARVEIERFRNAAVQAEASEDWQQAVSAYESALQIDSNLVFAQQGMDHAAKRLLLDQLLEAAIANPERFAEDSVYAETLDVFYTGRAIGSPGPRLTGQLARLQPLLESSQVPITVNLVSDAETQVTLLRVGDLGLFESQSVSLKPGRYVAIGTRRGYRDVREEFVVGFGQTPEAVVVKCDERIIASGSR